MRTRSSGEDIVKKWTEHFWFILGGLFLVNLVLAYIIFHRAKYDGDHLVYGRKVSAVLGKDAKGDNIKLVEGSWNLLLYLHNESYSDMQLARYANILYNRFQDKGLEVLGILEGTYEDIRTFRERNDLLYPLVSVHNLVEVPHLEEHRGVVLIDTSNVVRFVSPLNEESMRQLIEKYLLGSITYVPEQILSVQEGKLFPNIVLKPFGLEQKVLLQDVLRDSTLLFVFTSSCATCSIEPHLRTYSLLEEILQRNERFGSSVSVLLFSSKFSEDEIRDYLISTKIDGRVFLAQDEIPGVESTYFPSFLPFDEEVVGFGLDKSRNIHFIGALSDFAEIVLRDN